MKTTKKVQLVTLVLMIFLLLCCTERGDLSSSRLIRLGASREGYTRGSVNDLAGLSAVGDRVGIYGVVTTNSDALSYTLADEWNASPLMDNVRTTSIDSSTGVLFWADAYAYPLEEDRYVKFCVYHPYATSDGEGDNYVENRTNASPLLHFTLTGDEDVMWASPVLGSRTHSPDGLVFSHVLTQLRFRLVDDEGNFSDTNLTGLRFNGVNTRSTLDLETGATGSWGTSSDAVAFPLSESFTGGVSSVPISGTSSSPLTLSGVVMLQPGLSAFSLTVETDNKGRFSNVIITPSGGEGTFAAGHSYMVTLKFRERTPIALGAMVTPWVMTGTGEGTVQ